MSPPIRPVYINWKTLKFLYKLFSWIETLHLWKTDVEVKRNFMAKCVPPLGPGTYLVSGNSIMSLAKSTCFAQSMHWYRQTSFQNTHSLPAQAIPVHYLPQPGLRYCGFATNDSRTVSMTQVSLPSSLWASFLSFIWQWYVHCAIDKINKFTHLLFFSFLFLKSHYGTTILQ